MNQLDICFYQPREVEELYMHDTPGPPGAGGRGLPVTIPAALRAAGSCATTDTIPAALQRPDSQFANSQIAILHAVHRLITATRRYLTIIYHKKL